MGIFKTKNSAKYQISEAYELTNTSTELRKAIYATNLFSKDSQINVIGAVAVVLVMVIDAPLIDQMSHYRMLGYGFGHFYNDLCASMWFTYLMIFFENVLGFRSSISGLLMLIGQVVDAVCNPLVGIASDNSFLPAWFERRVGKRMSWHVIGTVCVTLSFPFIFNKCLVCSDRSSEWWSFAWFVLFISLFQFGWSAVQIAHLALIPELSQTPSARATMSSLRYASTVLANMAVYGVLAAFLNDDESQNGVCPEDLKHFSNAAYIVIASGVVATLIFYAMTKEPEGYDKKLNGAGPTIKRMSPMSWLYEPQFYQISALYTLSRLYMNVSQVYLPFYVTYGQNFSKTFVAIIPMVCYATSFFLTIPTSIPHVNRFLNKKIIFTLGCITGIANCIWMYFPLHKRALFAVSVIFGGVQAVLLVGSLAFSSDLINRNTESAAFVFGAMSFLDKLTNGVAYQIIELFNPGCRGENDGACTTFYRSIIAYVPGSCLVFALFVLLSLLTKKIGAR